MEETTAQTELKRAYMMITGGHLEEALEACDAALERAPDSPMPETMAGSFLASFGRHDEALKVLRKASRKDPNFALPHIYFAEASFFLGRKKVAERSLEKAKKLDEDGEFSGLIEHLDELFSQVDDPEPIVIET